MLKCGINMKKILFYGQLDRSEQLGKYCHAEKSKFIFKIMEIFYPKLIKIYFFFRFCFIIYTSITVHCSRPGNVPEGY